MPLHHEVEHCLGRDEGGFVEVLMKTERHPADTAFSPGSGDSQIVMEVKRQSDPLHPALDGGCADLAVALRGMAIPHAEQSVVHSDRQEEAAPRGELPAVDGP